MPALAPELATQAWFKVVEMATLMGNWPRVSAGLPIIARLVGLLGSIANIVIVFDPGFTAIMV